MVAFELGANRPRQHADILRHEKIVTHEPLDGLLISARDIAHPRRDLRLQIEGEPLFSTAREKMQMATHRPEKIRRAAEPARLVRREHARLHIIVGALQPINMARHPIERVEVAQAAFALFQIGLDHIARRAGARMTLVPFSKLRRDEIGVFVRHHLLAEPRFQIVNERAVPGDETQIEQRRLDRVVRARELEALVDGSCGMADLQRHVPQHVEHVFNDALGPRRLLVGA